MKISTGALRQVYTPFLFLVLIFVCGEAVSAEQLFEKDMVLVHGGCFQMGDIFGDGGEHERPVHEVCLPDYYISKYEVTQQQWQHVMNNNPALDQSNSNFPVDIVSWWDIEEFIEKLNVQTNQNYRLPTEAEWEFACRAGGKELKYGTKDGTLSKDLALYLGDEKSDKTVMPVGSFPPNQLGLYDMSGNASEWVMDWYDREHYRQSPVKNPVVLQTRLETLKVRRGGNWADQGWILRCTNRNYRRPGLRLTGLGFRLAKNSR